MPKVKSKTDKPVGAKKSAKTVAKVATKKPVKKEAKAKVAKVAASVDGTPDIVITQSAAPENSGKGARHIYTATKGSKKVATGTRRSTVVMSLANSHPKALVRYDWTGEQGYPRGKHLRKSPAA